MIKRIFACFCVAGIAAGAGCASRAMDPGWPHKGSAATQNLAVNVDQFLFLRPGDHYLDLDGRMRKRPKLSPGFRTPMGQEFSAFLRLDNKSGATIR